MLNKIVSVNMALLICGLIVGFFFVFVLMIDMKFNEVKKDAIKPIEYS